MYINTKTIITIAALITAAGIRALKTFCQTAVSLITVGNIMITQIDWITVIGVSATAALTSILTSIAGLPEAEREQ